jgi:hypothetical protein
MNSLQRLQVLALMLLGSLAFPLSGGAEPTVQAVENVRYTPQTGELLIDGHEKRPFTTQDVTHNARRKELAFFIPNATVQPTPKQVPVSNDPVIKGITLEQRALAGVPAVRVRINLYTSSPYVPFSLISQAPGLKMTVSHKDSPSKTATTAPSTDVKPAAQPVNTQTPKVTQAPTQPDSGKNTVMTLVGPVSPADYSIIQDVFYENNSLLVVSQKTPIAIKRSFLLTEPNRYVVDLSPAVLQTRSQMRAIPQSNPNILSFRASQLDEKTVRIVVQFANQSFPVDLSQWEGNKVLKLSFD